MYAFARCFHSNQPHRLFIQKVIKSSRRVAAATHTGNNGVRTLGSCFFL
jgi:hypothetical protein